MTTTTTIETKLEEAVDVPDTQDHDDNGDGPAFLISYMGDGPNTIEVVELAGTDDESLTIDELVERFDKADQRGSTWFKVGRRRIRISTIKSVGPENEVDYPEIAIFSSIEERTEKLFKGVGQVLEAINQSAQGMAYLAQQQAGLQSAQASLFSSIEAEETLDEGEEGTVPAGPSQPPAKASRPTKIPGAMRPLRVPGMPPPQ